ncbi:BatA domain-containing protein [Rhodocytophaga aerolata]|uniref:BatA domain-containing protein n=1 Tax=Rhodocytophaga aerolata TaxID=455078 RepID=A0ABT8R175_9BACT|nr:BatA domain-containing protein [Rhodocytophaga aerolata]MDO1445846.1 BatA domain-containing protein [Rhodocytophaga aerolata]
MWQINHPAYWWALLAMAVPIVIHLYNRRRTQVKLMGSLRWVEEVQTAQWNFRRVHLWPLLLIRLLLLTVVVLLLVDLYKKDTSGKAERLHALLLIHPEAGDTSQYRQLAAGWQNDSVHVHWLASGFPAATNPITEDSKDIWSLVAEADLRFPADSIHMIAPNQQHYFKGTPPRIRAALSWELTDMQNDSLQLVWAGETNTDPELLWFHTQAQESVYQVQKGLHDSSPGQIQTAYSADKKYIEVKKGAARYRVPLSTPDTLTIAAVVNEDTKEEGYLFQKAVQAVAQYQKVPVKFIEENTAATDWVVLFDTTTALTSGLTKLMWVYEPGKSIDWLEKAGKNKLVIRKELTTANILEGGFLEALRPYISEFKYKQAATPHADFRKIDLAGNQEGEKEQITSFPESVQQKAGRERVWLGLFLLLIITLERLWPKKLG